MLNPDQYPPGPADLPHCRAEVVADWPPGVFPFTPFWCTRAVGHDGLHAAHTAPTVASLVAVDGEPWPLDREGD